MLKKSQLRKAQQIGILFPGCPPDEAAAIAEHTARRGSGRIGPDRGGPTAGEQALTLAVIAAVRHNHTDYDELLVGAFASGIPDLGSSKKHLRGFGR